MKIRRYALLLLFIVLGAASFGLAGHRDSSAKSPFRPRAELALRQLHSDFHLAATIGDHDLMRSLWTENAGVSAGGNQFFGPERITEFFSSGPNWGRAASLSPTYTATYEVHGKTATLQFECIIVNTGDLDPINTSLSSIPFGEQSPGVEIVQHSTATCVAVRQGKHWLIDTFVGSAGPP